MSIPEIIDSDKKNPEGKVVKDNDLILGTPQTVGAVEGTPAILPLKDDNPIDLETEKNINIQTTESTRKMEEEEQARKEKKEVVVADIKPLEPPKENSVIGVSFTITNMCLGSTIFTYASRAKCFGLVWLLIFSAICAIVNYWTIIRQVRGAQNLIETDYSDIVKKLFGNKVRIIFNIMMIVYIYGIIMMFISVIYALLGRFVYSISYKNDYAKYENFSSAKWDTYLYKISITLALGVAIIALCIPRDVSFLNPMSYVAVASVLYSLLVVTVQCNKYYNYAKSRYKEDDPSTHINYTDLGKAFTSKLDFFKGMATLFFSYSCHMGMYPIYASFKPFKNPIKKMQLSVIGGMIMTIVLMTLGITVDFLTNPLDPEDLVIYREKLGGGKDIAMDIAKIMVAISIFVSIPPNYMPLRLAVANTFLKDGKMSNKFNIIFTICSILGSCLVTIFYDKVLNYFSYLGGFLAPFISYFFPVMIWIINNGKPFIYWKNLVEFAGSMILVIIGIMSGILTIIDDLSG